MSLLRPIYALRTFTASITIVLIILMFAVENSFLIHVLLGFAAGVSLVVQKLVWSKQLQWHEGATPAATRSLI